jgi:hypothetical protein
VPSRRAIRKSLKTNFNPDLRWRAERVLLRTQQLAHLPALLMGAELDRPIFIVGAPRSGTMLLYRILRSHSRLAHWRPSEAHEVWEADYHPALRGWESNVLGASDVDPEAAARIRRSFLLVTGRHRRLIDKTPRNVLRVPFVDAVFPDARYVYLKRDGRDNVNSLINAWRSPRYRTYELPQPHSIPGTDPRWWKFVLYPGWRHDASGPLEVVCAKQWSICNDRVVAASQHIGPDRWAEIRYEDLIDDPVSEVGRLMEFLRLDYERVVRESAAATDTTPVNVVTPPERGKWRRENPKEIEAIFALIAPMMDVLGYRLDNQEKPRVRPR